MSATDTHNTPAPGSGGASHRQPAHGNDPPPLRAVTGARSLLGNWWARRYVLKPVLPWLGIVLVLGCVTAFFALRFEPAIAAADANGYWAQGSRLAVEGRSWFVPESDPEYVGMHWLLAASGRYHSRYPAGLPLLIAAVHRLFGPDASVWVNPGLSLMALFGFWLLLRQHVSEGWALGGVALLGSNPTFLRHALTCDSHMAVVALLIWGLLLLTLWGSDGRLWQVALAGLILGSVPTVRYPETLIAIGAGLFLLCHWRRRRWWLHVGVAAAAALIPLIPLMIYNRVYFGAFWRTAYSLSNEQTAFSWAYLQAHAIQYVQAIHSDGVGLFFGLGIAGIAVMCATPRARAAGLFLAGVVIPMTVLYMAYYWGPAGRSSATMRFVLPTFPCYVLAGVWCVHRLQSAYGRILNGVTAGVLLLVQVFWGTLDYARESQRDAHTKACLATATRALRGQAASGDVVMANRALLQHLDFVREWKVADAAVVSGGGRRRRRMPGGRAEDAPSPRQAEKMEAESSRYAWMSQVEREAAVAQDLCDWAGDGRIFFVGPEDELSAIGGSLFARSHFRIVARVSLPAAPDGGGASRRGRGATGDGMVPPMPPSFADDLGPMMAGDPGMMAGGPGMMAGGPGMMGGAVGRFRPGGRGRGGGPGAGNFGAMAGGGDIVVAEWVGEPDLPDASEAPAGAVPVPPRFSPTRPRPEPGRAARPTFSPTRPR